MLQGQGGHVGAEGHSGEGVTAGRPATGRVPTLPARSRAAIASPPRKSCPLTGLGAYPTPSQFPHLCNGHSTRTDGAGQTRGQAGRGRPGDAAPLAGTHQAARRTQLRGLQGWGSERQSGRGHGAPEGLVMGAACLAGKGEGGEPGRAQISPHLAFVFWPLFESQKTFK